MTNLRPAPDVSSADWIVVQLRTFAESVLSLVPDGFPAYVRVFHPAYRLATEEQESVRWAEIANANGRQAHAGMQLCGLTGSYRFEHQGQPDVFDQPPSVGSLPRELLTPLAAALARHSWTAERCWFAVWNGFGGLRSDVRLAPTFRVPHRKFHLLMGPVEGVTESVEDEPWDRSPNLWWPDDHAWCVATEIDLKTTYIACSAACREELLTLPELEALAIDPASGIDSRSDLLNPCD